MKHTIVKLLIITMLALAAVSVYAQDDFDGKDDTAAGPPAGPVWDIVDNEVTDSPVVDDYSPEEDDGVLEADPTCDYGVCWCSSHDRECVDTIKAECELTGGRVEEGPDTTACWYDDDDPAPTKKVNDLVSENSDTKGDFKATEVIKP